MPVQTDIELTRSHVEANVGGDGNASVTLNAGGAITIDDSEKLLLPEMKCVWALIDGDGDALIDLDADNDITIIDDLILADVDGIGTAEVNIETTSGDIKLSDSEVKAQVKFFSDDYIEIDDSEIEARIIFEAANDINVNNSDVKAKIEIEAEDGGVKIIDSLVEAEVELKADGRIEITDGSNVKSTVEIEFGSEEDESGIEIADNEIKANVKIKVEGDESGGGYDGPHKKGCSGSGGSGGVGCGGGIEIAGSDVEAEVKIKIEGDESSGGSGGCKKGGGGCGGIGIASSDVEAKVEIASDRKIHIHNDSKVNAKVEMDTGEKINIHNDSEVNAKVNLDATTQIHIHDYSKVEAKVDLDAKKQIHIHGGGCGDSSDGDSSKVEAKVNLAAEKQIHIHDNGKINTEVKLNTDDQIHIHDNGRINTEIKLDAGEQIHIHDNGKINTKVKLNADDQIHIHNDGKIDTKVKLVSEDHQIHIEDGRINTEIKLDAGEQIHIHNDGKIEAKVDLDADDDSDANSSDINVRIYLKAKKDINIEDSKVIAYVDGKKDSEAKITLHADKDISIGGIIKSVGGNTADVSITAGGWIRDVEAARTIIADTLTLFAADGIGETNNYLDTEVANLTATTTEEGAGIYIEEKDGLIIDTINAGGLADIFAHGDSVLGSITTVGDFTFQTTLGDVTILSGTVTSNLGGVNIQSDLGSICADGAGPHIKALTTSYLIAPNGVVGTIDEPINVDITSGDLEITAGGIDNTTLVDGSITAWNNDTDWGVSSNIIGTVFGDVIVNPADATSFPPDLDFDPQGYVLFNDVEIWPDLVQPVQSAISPEVLAQLLVLLGTRFDWPAQSMLGFFRVYPMDISGAASVYYYHPLVSSDYSAFEGFQLTEDMYEFIEGQLEIKEGEFSSWLEAEFNK